MIKLSVTTYLTVIFCFVLLFSCDDNYPSKAIDETGTIQLSFSELIVEGGRTQQQSLSILLSIKNESGTLIHEKKVLQLFKFGTEYLSEPIALNVGNFKLTEFIVLNENNEAVYATPLEHSPLAYLVERALPFDFTITKDATVKIKPQVLECADYSPGDFGYNTFTFEIVKAFPFLIGVLAYDTNTQNFELTTARLVVKMADDTLYNYDLEAKTNTVKVRSKEEVYSVNVLKDGYFPFQKTFTSSELKLHAETPLVVTLLHQSINEGLIAHYPFNGHANDSTVNGYDGIVHEAVLTSDRHGNSNAAYVFDGINDYIQVPHTPALNLSDDFTISLWAEVAHNQVPHEGINDILRKWNGNTEGYPFAIAYLNELADDFHEDKFIYVRYDGAGCMNSPTTYSSVVDNNVFQHLILVKQGNTLKQYLNNVLVEEIIDNTFCSTENTADMTIGCRGNLVRFFKGKIDDIRIYGRAISKDEVAVLYHE